MICRRIRYFGQDVLVMCDALCGKAWGISSRPQVDLSEDPDDFAYLADGELGEAPSDPGTYEGGHAKPAIADARLNKWCVRECERSSLIPLSDEQVYVEVSDFSSRLFNKRPTPAKTGETDGR